MSESESIKYLDKTGLAYFWDKIKAAFVKKEAGKGLSSNDYTSAEKTKLEGLPTGANVLTTSDKGAANGVCPLDANGKVLGTYLPAMDAEIYVVSVQTDGSFLNPTANASELAAIHTKYDDGVLCYLKIRAQGMYNDYYVPMYSHYISDTECEFLMIVNGEFVVYSVVDNMIMAEEAPLMPGMTDHIIASGTDSNGWAYRKYASGISECWGRFTYANISFTQYHAGEGFFSTSELPQENYPTGLFIAAPCETDEIIDSSANGWLASGGGGNTAAKTQSELRIARFTDLTEPGTYTISRHATGRWKN